MANGADGHAGDDRGRLEAALLRQALDDAGWAELGVAASDDGTAWAMLVRADDDEAVHAAVLDAWRIAGA